MHQVIAALHAPVAPLTWEIQAELPDQQQQTGRIPLDFRGPLEIVGLHPTVIATTAAANLRDPNPDDLLALIDINNEERLTNRLEQGGAAGPGSSFVSLSALGVLLPRLLRKRITNARPNVAIQFRWKRAVVVGMPYYQDAIVSVAFMVRYLDEEAR